MYFGQRYKDTERNCFVQWPDHVSIKDLNANILDVRICEGVVLFVFSCYCLFLIVALFICQCLFLFL